MLCGRCARTHYRANGGAVSASESVAHVSASVSVAASNAGSGLGAQVIERSLLRLQADPCLPSLAAFQTVSPVPGFAVWLGAGAAAAGAAWARHASAGHAALSLPSLSSLCVLKAAAATYLLQRVAGARVPRVIDPVANFHLGNGAVIENIMVRNAWRSENNHHPPALQQPSRSYLTHHCCRSGWRRRHARRAAPFTRRHGQVRRPLKRPQPTPSPQATVAAIATPPTPTSALTIAACTRNTVSWPSAAGSPRRTPLYPARRSALCSCLLAHFTQHHTFASQSARLLVAYLSRALLLCNSRATLQRCLRLWARGGSGRRRRQRVASPAAPQHDDNAVVMPALLWLRWLFRQAAPCCWSFVDYTRGAALSLPRCARWTRCVTQPHGHHAHLGSPQ
jgi:hypothetical protein